ncbi:MAG: TonB-dependent receptor [Chromatiales bacterium]|nr:MAG: TonB-dependent receptor [Chromatiales bacterium]
MLSANRGNVMRFQGLLRSGHALAHLALLTVAPGLVVAQESTSAREATTEIADIVVTVRKQEESLQAVPLSVSVISEEQIEQLGINSLGDVAQLTTGVILDQGFAPQDTRIVIRGLSPTRGRPNAAVLQDGIDISSEGITTAGGSLLINPRLVDIKRVEIVKGPQSALYGRSAFAGAINYVTQEPAEELSRRVSAQVGSDGRYEGSVAISGPVSNTLRLGLNGATWSDDGFYTNTVTGGPVGGDEGSGWAGTALWQPGEIATIRARVEYSDDSFDPPTQATVVPNTTRPMPSAAVSVVVSSAVTEVLVPLGVAPAGDSVTLRQSENPRTGVDYDGTDRNVFRTSLISEFDLGNATFTSLTHYATADTSQALDGQRKRSIGDLPVPGSATNNYAEINIDQSTDLFSQELRYSWAGDGPLSWTAGALYWLEKADVQDYSLSCFVLPNLTCESFVAAIGTTEPAYSRDWSRDTEHWSLYGLVEWRFTQDWKFTLEGRYVNEDLKVSGPDSAAIIDPFSLLGSGVTVPPPANTVSDKDTDSYFVPKVTLEWQARDDLMLYASIGEGVKPSGISTITGGAAGFEPESYRFDPEKMWAYELGTKSTWLDGTLTANGAVFYQDYTDKQAVTQVQLANGTIGIGPINAGSAHVLGLELEVNWQPVEGLALNVGYTLLDAEYDDFVQDTRSASNIARAGNCVVVPAAPVVPPPAVPQFACTIDLSGKRLEGAPTGSLVAGASYTAPLAGELSYLAGLQSTYQSKRYQSEFNDLAFDSFWLLNMRLGLLSPSWELIAYVDNVTDDDTIKSGFTAPDFDSFTFISNPPPSTFVTTNMAFYSLPDPRTVGIRASFRF